MFAAYNLQLREHYGSAGSWRVGMVGDDFRPVNLGDWFHERIVEWSASRPKGRATTHIFRKTSLRYARSGEDVNRQVARDSRLSESVLMRHCVKERDEAMRAPSKRTFRRIAAALPPDVAQRYGYIAVAADPLLARLEEAKNEGNWPLVTQLATDLTIRTR